VKDEIGFIGLGNLGFPMATNLLDAGCALAVYNRTASKAEPLRRRGARIAARPADVIVPGGILVSVVWDDAALAEVVTSEGLLRRLGAGGVHISMSTVSPATARRMAKLHLAHGADYVEAPVFGRPEAALARKLWIPIAGSPAAKDRIRPVLTAIGAQSIFDFGEHAGAATTVKLAGNFLLISAARSLAEALAMAEKSGVDSKAMVEMLTSTLFPAPIYQSYGKVIAEKLPLPPSAIPLKDLGLFKRTAEQVSSPAPIASQLSDLLRSS
jgi:3-hydroxyisobutyrate dehydrogenase-like beta-hydroxyacid dehydrogenase